MIVVEVAANSVNRKLVMIELKNLVGIRAAQYFDQVIDAKTLAGTEHHAQRHACCLGAVPGAYRFKTGIAVATRLRLLLAEIPQQRLASATGNFAKTEHGVEAMLLGAFVFFAAVGLHHHLPQLDDVLQTIQQQSSGWRSISSCATGFLIIGFNRFGHVEMRDKPHIGFVDAHAERNGRHHDQPFLALKPRLMRGAHFCIKARMVRQCIETFAL